MKEGETVGSSDGGSESSRNRSSVQGKRLKQCFGFCAVGVLTDLLLGGFKIFMGWESGSISVIGDGFNNMTDAGSVFLLMLTFYFASRPSDREHPFGHGRMEYLNSTLMGTAVVYVGVSLLRESAEKIFHPQPVLFSMELMILLVTAIAGKLFLAWLYRTADEAVGSKAFRAYSADSLADVAATGGVLMSLLAEKFWGWTVDGWAGAAVSFVVLYAGYEILKSAVNALIGAPPNARLYQAMEKKINSYPGIYGVHDMIIHDYGPGSQFVSAHAEMDSRMSLVESHQLADRIMQDMLHDFHAQTVIHVDPRAVDNPREPKYRKDLETAIIQSGLPVTFHDFFTAEKRDGIHLSFELGLERECPLSDREIYDKIDSEMKKLNPNYVTELLVDRNFISGQRYGGISTAKK